MRKYCLLSLWTLLFLMSTAGVHLFSDDANFFGNTSSRKFHTASCRYASCASCTANFHTANEALKAGYVPCKVCNPSSAQPQHLSSSVDSNQGGSEFVGNTSSWKFHSVSCRHASCASCTVGFKTAGEAIQAGYVPCKVCNPSASDSAIPNNSLKSQPPTTSKQSASGQCSAITKKGTRCKRTAAAGSAYCWQHGGG